MKLQRFLSDENVQNHFSDVASMQNRFYKNSIEIYLQDVFKPHTTHR